MKLANFFQSQDSIFRILGLTITFILVGSCLLLAQPTIATQPSSVTVCRPNSGSIGTTLTIDVNRNGCTSFNSQPPTFQWEYFDGTVWSNISNGTPIGFSYTSSQSGNQNTRTGTLAITVSSASSANSFIFRCTVTASGCGAGGNSRQSNPATITVNPTPNVSNFSASVSSSCTNTGVPVTVNSSTLASGTYTVNYDLNVSNGGSANNQSATMVFTSGSPSGSGSFTTVSHSGTSATVTITGITLNGCTGSLSYTTGSATNNALPNLSQLVVTASGADIGNTDGSTVTIQSSRLSAGSYTVVYNVRDAATNTTTFIPNTSKTLTLSPSTRRNRVTGNFTTGLLSTAGQYRVNIVSITNNTTGCTSTSSSFATFSIIGAWLSVTNGLWDNPATWGLTTGTGPSFRDGTIIIGQNTTVTYDSSSIADVLELDQLIIRGTLVINSNQVMTLKNGSSPDIDMDIVSGGRLQIGTDPVVPSSALVNGTLNFEQGVTHSGTSASSVEFKLGSLYRHQFTTSEGAPPIATWAPTSTCRIEGYTSASGDFSSPGWSQNFGEFEWNCPSQTGDINLNGLLGSLSGSVRSVQNNITIQSTGSTGILRLGNTTNYTLTIPGNLNINGSSLFSTGPSSGNGPVIILNMANFNYSSTASSWICQAGQATVNISGNMNLNSGRVYLSDGGGTITRSGATINLTGNITIGSSATMDASSSGSDKLGKLVFTNSGSTHLFTNNGAIAGQVLYQIDANQIVRAVNESAFISSSTAVGAFTVAAGATLIVESTDALGAIQSGTTAANLRVADVGRTFVSGSTIEYGRTTLPLTKQFIGSGHPSTTGVNCKINNTSGVDVSTNGAVVVSGVLDVKAGTLTVTNNDLTVTGNTTITGGILALNSTGQASGRTLTLNGSLSRSSGSMTVTSSATDSENANVNFNGDFLNTDFLSFSGANCNVTIAGTTPAAFTSSFPISAADDVESFTINKTGAGAAAILNIPYALNVGTTGSNASPANGLFITSGNMRMNAALTVNRSTSITSGSLDFSGQTATLKESIITNSAGFLSSNSSSALIIDGTFTGTSNNLFFAPSTILGTLTLNRSAGVTPHVVLGNSVTVSTLNLTDGELSNPSVLVMGSGAVINRTGQATFASGSAAPTGGPYDVNYNNYTNGGAFINPSVTSLNSGVEIGGSQLRNVTSTLSGTATLTTAMNGSGLLTVSTGTFTCAANAVSMGSVLNNATLNAPSTTLTLTGDFTNNSSFSANGGTLIFNGTSTIGGATVPTTFNNVTLNTTRSLTLPSALMNVTGTFESNGTLNAGTGTVAFTGTTLQEIKGSPAATFNNINISNTLANPVRIESAQNIRGILTLSATANFDADGLADGSEFTLLSTGDKPTVDASVAAIPTTAILNGKITVQRFMSAIGPKNRYISMPVTGANLQDLADDNIDVQYGGWIYDETVLGAYNNGWKQTDRAYSFVPGKGFLVYMWGGSGATWDVRGPLTKESNRGRDSDNGVSLPVTYTSVPTATPGVDGWNLVGNPFPSAIQWNSADWSTSSNISPIIYVPDMSANVFRTWDRTGNSGLGSGSLPNGNIAMGQAFWVYVNSPSVTPSVIVNESAKKTTSSTFYRISGTEPTLKIALSNGDVSDYAFIFIRENATSNYDNGIDGLKLEGKLMGISIFSEDMVKLVHYSTNELSENEIPLNVMTSEEGNFSISFEATSGAEKFDELYLLDKYTNTLQPITNNTLYDFSVTNDVLTKEGRFFLIRGASNEGREEASLTIFPNPATESVSINVNSMEVVPVSVYNVSGTKMTSTIIASQDGVAQGTIDLKSFPAGLYLVKSFVDGQLIINKVVKK